MNNKNTIVSYLLAFVLFALAFKWLGFARFDNYELLAVVFVGYGAGTVYSSMGNSKKLSLFLGTVSFLVGIVFFLIGKQEIFYSPALFFPSALFILGAGGLMLYIDNTADKAMILISVIFIVLGFIYVSVKANFDIGSFFSVMSGLIAEYWLVVIVAVIVIFLSMRGGKKQ